jgi:hypothetical protein
VTFLRILPVAALILLTACQYPSSRSTLPYGPTEEGLTLAYEDPSLPQPERSQERLQVRVARAKFQDDGTGVVRLNYTSHRVSLDLLLRHQQGGIALISSDGMPLAQLLPEGFPQTETWEAHGTRYHVLGRATWDGAGLLPETRDPVGVWVESRPESGPRRRTLYLHGLGEVETQELRGSVWVTVNRLVSLGFTDLPIAPPSHP